MADFGPNEWLVDELYQQYLQDKNSVDKAWWEFFADYHPTDTGNGNGSGQGSENDTGSGSVAPSRSESAEPQPFTTPAAPVPAPEPIAPAPTSKRAANTATAQIGTKAAPKPRDIPA
ncbi:MAG TPA: hypothetical protein VFE92_03850, partial [Dermatophilaceae bacterium]|nr:hypothetical protein [Dermatophilaceae bacterium]